eukprot:scaffold303858_cov35-Tisochrysis_lutea.AAC.1
MTIGLVVRILVGRDSDSRNHGHGQCREIDRGIQRGDAIEPEMEDSGVACSQHEGLDSCGDDDHPTSQCGSQRMDKGPRSTRDAKERRRRVEEVGATHEHADQRGPSHQSEWEEG